MKAAKIRLTPPNSRDSNGFFCWNRSRMLQLCILVGIGMCSVSQFVLFSNIHTNVNIGIPSSSSAATLQSPLLLPPTSAGAVDRDPLSKSVNTCKIEQLEIIKQQLPPGDCQENSHQPFTQRCSFSYATKCPDDVWVDKYYKELHSSQSQHGQSPAAIQGNKNIPQVFTGIFVGCNKGMDAVDTMRMGSGNPIFDKSLWRDAITKGGELKLGKSVCNQANSPQFELPAHAHEISGTQNNNSMAQVHCIEPMPRTARALSHAAHELQWDQHGFIVTHAAIAKGDGIIPFPSGKYASGVGKENKGISNCKVADGVRCVNVAMYSLDTYVEKYIPHDGPIHYLSIDVEGFDMDVLLGGRSNALKRVHYLEFEYNWMGSWRGQKLSDAIGMLDNDFGFTCYWPGFDNNIWRITDCWLDHYDLHYWSNVACVKRGVEEVKKIAERMEQMFLETVSKRDDVVMDYDHRYNYEGS